MKILFAAIFAIILSPAIASDSTNVETRNDLNEVGAQLNHHQTVEVVVQQLLRRVEQLETRNEAQQQTIKKHLVRIEHLESRDNDQHQLILNLRSELVVQRRHTNSLERFIGKISKVACQPEEKKKGVSQTGIQPGKILPAQTAYVEENSPEDQKVTGYDMYKTSSRIRRADNEETIAFFATLTNHLEHAGVQQTFVFDRIVTNLGHGYSNHSGKLHVRQWCRSRIRYYQPDDSGSAAKRR